MQEVVDSFQSRSQFGIKKYGHTLDRKDLNVQQWITHLQEELMDATLYAQRLRKEFPPDDYVMVKRQELIDLLSPRNHCTNMRVVACISLDAIVEFKKKYGLETLPMQVCQPPEQLASEFEKKLIAQYGGNSNEKSMFKAMIHPPGLQQGLAKCP